MSASTVPSPADLGADAQMEVPEQASVRPRKVLPARGRDLGPQRLPDRRATDDEILGIGGPSAGTADDGDARNDPQRLEDAAGTEAALSAALEANPELRRVWDDAQAYRQAFATPEAAQAATAQLADLGRLDALFFSRRPEDHAELARVVAGLDPAAFASLAQAMASLSAAPKAASPVGGTAAVRSRGGARRGTHGQPALRCRRRDSSRRSK